MQTIEKNCKGDVRYPLNVHKALSARHPQMYFSEAQEVTSVINVLILSLRTNSKETPHMHISTSSQYNPRCAKPKFGAVKTLGRKGIRRIIFKFFGGLHQKSLSKRNNWLLNLSDHVTHLKHLHSPGITTDKQKYI